MSDCIFCRIVAGEIPSRQVHADEHAIAFLDMEPFKTGHTLVVPRAHVTDALADADVLASIAPAIAATGKLLVEKLGASGMNVLSNVGEDAGQSVFHLHVHLVPRYADDAGMGVLLTRTASGDLDEVHRRITG
ncbi:HIT family protein [Propioniciclava sinopodophylli]|uniref:HIT family protein n=1 Tax=Propioniciclava sinopodophylli TaxID=1837344 RepID=UPI002492AA97|nr:HIT family protein [Propioniciclava sinopodophylli]